MSTSVRTVQYLLAGMLVAGAAGAQSTRRVSVASGGLQGDGPSVEPRISADGRHVLFMSSASNLVPGDTNGSFDVFLHDLETGATTRVSVDSNGVEGNNWSYSRGLSADARFVAFDSHATNLVPGDTNAASDVFVRDLSTGVTTRVSIATSGAQADAGAGYAAISADGRYVAFESIASNLVGGDTGGWSDVFLHDRQTGVTRRVSVNSSGVAADRDSEKASISADGRYVAFQSRALNLAPGDPNGTWDVFVHDAATGVTACASTTPSGLPGDGLSDRCAISADGRYVAFTSSASNLVPDDTSAAADVFVRDRLTGETLRASTSPSGPQANPYAFQTSISGDGRYASFTSPTAGFVPGDTNGRFDVFVRDAITGAFDIASVHSSGALSNDESAVDDSSRLSFDGRYVAFASRASNLVAGDTNGVTDVFLRDRTGSVQPGVSCSGDGSAAPCPCANPGSPWRGCAHSSSSAGALLLGSGSASLALDTFRLDASGMPPASSVVYFQGASALGGGLGATFGNGLRCVGGQLRRLGRKLNSAGSSSLGPAVGDAPISVLGHVPSGGGTFHYQAVYRNTGGLACDPAGVNTTNGLSVVWVP